MNIFYIYKSIHSSITITGQELEITGKYDRE